MLFFDDLLIVDSIITQQSNVFGEYIFLQVFG